MSHMKPAISSLLTIGLLTALSSPASAVDGVVLIDQNRALAGNVTPGDGPGFPVTISIPGSYRLAGNLTVPNADTTAIAIAPNIAGVTIDLNGFSIIGPTVCAGFPLSCTPRGSGSGVFTLQDVNFASARAVTVRNGTVTGMGSYGLFIAGAGSSAEDLNIFSNGADGLVAELGTVLRNKVYKNGGVGINGGNAVIAFNNVFQNRSAGITVNDSIVTNNAMIVNGGVGLAASNTGFASNVFSSNNGGFANPQFTGPKAIGANICDGSVCP